MSLKKYYENLSYLHVGTEENRSYYIPEDREGESRAVSLNEEWDFAFYESVSDLPESFPCDGAWMDGEKIPVPSVWQMHGYDRHQYTNTPYPFPYDPP